jgi:hypothetical protein
MATSTTVRDIAEGARYRFREQALPSSDRWLCGGAEMSSLACPYVLARLEPLTGCLQVVRPLALSPLAAPMAQAIALTALATLGLSDAPVHEPVHGRDPPIWLISLLCVTMRAKTR